MATKKLKGDKKLLTVQLGELESGMIEDLKGAPHFMNISEFIRASIRHIHEVKCKKKKKEKEEV